MSEMLDFDSAEISYQAEIFDVIVANHMLYHVSDIDKTLLEIRRVLKNGGRFYASTMGNANMKELHEIIVEFDDRIVPPNQVLTSFSLENVFVKSLSPENHPNKLQ